MKTLLLGIAFIILVGVGGLVYRNAVEYSTRQIKCPVEKFVCPDGTVVTHEGLSCDFQACPLPNVTLDDLGISFAVPEGFESGGAASGGVVAGYTKVGAGSTEPIAITIRRLPLDASTTPLAVIQKASIDGASGEPVSPSRYSTETLGSRIFTVVPIERFEGVVDIAFYLTRGTDVLRFDAIDRGVDWTNPSLDIRTLPAQAALRGLLSTLQGS